MTKDCNFIEQLREAGLRPTKQRVKICEILFNREKTFHFTVEKLNKILNKKENLEKISLATIYNTVSAFKKAGHLKEILTNNNTSYFDTNISSHHHFFDIDTNELEDINYNEIQVTKMPHATKGKKFKDLEVTISVQRNTNLS